MGGKAWTHAEEVILRDVFENGHNIARSVSRFDGRTYEGIKAHAKRLKLDHADYRSWTPEEDAILREIWTTPRNIKVGMHRLERRSYEAAKIRAARLCLGKKTPAEKGTRSYVLRSVKAILAGGVHMSMKEIAAKSGMDRKSIQGVISENRGKEFYVASWGRVDAWHSVMKFALGTGPDAPKPAAKTLQEYWKGYRDRKRLKRGGFNPFAAAAGLIEAPKGEPGRVYIHLTDSKDDEYADEMECAA
jgi:hypothetical protein